jgi:NADH-quinone oxidoreductase subunit G
MLVAAGGGQLAALVIAGVDPFDLADPQAALRGLEACRFVVSLETRASAVTERADVVFPVALVDERPGTFLTWEGRDRPFQAVFERPGIMSDLRVLAALADGLGSPLGLRTAAEARAELAELGPWEGAPLPAPALPPARPSVPRGTTVVLATWRLALDRSRALDHEPYLQATAHTPVARLSARTAAAAGIDSHVTVANDRGAITLAADIVPDMVDGVVWLPTRSAGSEVPEQLAALAGDLVEIRPAQLAVAVARAHSTEPIPAEVAL